MIEYVIKCASGKAPCGAISAEPYASKLTTAFVRNANPIQICKQI